MRDDNTTQCWLFEDLAKRQVVVRFDQERGSSDGGAVLLAAADRRLGLSEALAGCIRDDRAPERVVHEILDLVRHRVYGIACGYPDGNDAARLSSDPVHKLLVGRSPVDGDLASQPTLSRFENGAGRADLFRMGEVLAERVIERHCRRRRGRARVVTIDLDQTDDPAHGEQQLALFNGYYGEWCYLPLLGFVSFDDEADQYLVAAILRPGNSPDKRGSLGVLSRLLPRLRKAFPKARFRVRLDAGFAAPEIFGFLDEQVDVEYAVAMGKNAILLRRAGKHMARARRLSKATGQTEHVYAETRYATKSWPRKRRVIIKAEVTRHPGRDPKDNPRFVVTNMTQTPRWVYEKVYCQRGEIENRIKELHHGLEIDRTSCSRFLANQLRVLLTAAAYVLMQELRLLAARTSLARAQVSTLRERLLKIGARLVVSVRRLAIHLPASYPFLVPWGRIATRLGAPSV